MTTQKTLSNGARVVLAPFAGTEAAAILVLFKIGSRNEDLPVWGGSHFIEHLMFKGTERRPETLDISLSLDRHGARYNAYTGKDLTGYWIKIAGSEFPLAVDLLHDMLYHSKFDAQEMDREKKVIIEEIKMYDENPIMHIEELLEEAMFGDHVLGRNIAGTADSMRAMKREDVLAYRDVFYRPDNMVIVVAGKLPDDIVEILEKTFGVVEPRDGVTPQDLPIGSQTETGRICFQYKELEQVQLALGFPAIARGHVDEPALKILTSLLGGGMSSRLFVEVRERRGLCYDIQASVDAYQDTGSVMIRSGLDKARVTEALQVISDEILKVRDGKVTEDELQIEKDKLRGGLALSLESSVERSEFYARQLLFLGKIEEPAERLAKYDAVTLADVARVAKTYLRFDRMSLAAIGPFASDTELAALLPKE